MEEKSNFKEKMPIKLEKISKKLWPRKFYVRIKEFHPILGSIFLFIWTIFWFVLTLTLNVLLVFVLLLTIIFLLAAIFGDSGFDSDFLVFSGSSKKKDKEKGMEY